MLADPWDPPCSIPTKFLTQLTHLSYLAEGLLLPRIAAQFCQALGQLQQLQELQLHRLQLSPQVAQQLAQVLSELPHLQALALSGGATPVSAAELYMLLNGTVAMHVEHPTRLHVGIVCGCSIACVWVHTYVSTST